MKKNKLTRDEMRIFKKEIFKWWRILDFLIALLFAIIGVFFCSIDVGIESIVIKIDFEYNKEIIKWIALINFALYFAFYNLSLEGLKEFREDIIKNRYDIYSKEDIKKIFEYVNKNDSDYKYMLYVCYHFGLRPSEMFNLKKNDVKYALNGLYVYATKTNTERLIISYDVKVLNALLPLIDNCSSEYLFYNYKENRQYEKNDLKNLFRRIKDKTKIKKANLYMFRHTYITDLIELNVPLVVVQQQAGHSDIKTTMGYYHASIKYRCEEMQKIKRTI